MFTYVKANIPANLVEADTIEQVPFMLQLETEAASSFGFWFGISIVGVYEVFGSLEK